MREFLRDDLTWLWGVIRCQCQNEREPYPEHYDLWPSWAWASVNAELSNTRSPWFYRAYWRGIYSNAEQYEDEF